MTRMIGRRFLGLLTAVFAVALAVATMPVTARAEETQTYLPDDSSVAPVIMSCPVCGGGVSHTGWHVIQIMESDIKLLWPDVPFVGGEIDPNGCTSSDPNVASVVYEVVPINEEETEPRVMITALAPGSTTITITSTGGDKISFPLSVRDISDDIEGYLANVNDPLLTDAVNSLHKNLTSFEIADDTYTLDGQDAYQIRIEGTPINFRADGAFEVTSVTVSDERVATVSQLQDPFTGEDEWRLYPGVVGGTATLTATAVSTSDPSIVLTDTATVTCTPGEGWVPAQDFTIGEDGVLAVPLSWADLGGYGLFDWDFMEAVYYDLSVTVDDPSVARVEGYGYSITPLKTGTTTITVTITDKFYGGTKSAKATLAVTDGPAMTVISNEQGATLSHEAKLVDDGFGGTYNDDSTWRELDLVTEWLGGEAASAAGDAINAAVSGVSSMYVYDIHLEQYGQVFEIPEGDSVTVTLPLPEGMEPDGVRVFHVADDGTVTDMGATVDAEARTVTFTTTHFSTFVLANVGGQPDGQAVPETKPAGEKNVTEPSGEAVPATGDAGSAAALLAAGSGAAALLGSRALRRRRG